MTNSASAVSRTGSANNPAGASFSALSAAAKTTVSDLQTMQQEITDTFDRSFLSQAASVISAGDPGGAGSADNENLAAKLLNLASQTGDRNQQATLLAAASDVLGGDSTAAPPLGAMVTPGAGALTVNGDTINTGRYTITMSAATQNNPGGISIYDNKTHTSLNISGKGDIASGSGVQASFSKNGLTLHLADGTEVHVQPSTSGNSAIQDVVVTQGNEAVQSQGFDWSSGVQVNPVQSATAAQVDGYFSGGATTTVLAGDTGLNNLSYIDPKAHQQVPLSAGQTKPGAAAPGAAAPNLDPFAAAPQPAAPTQAAIQQLIDALTSQVETSVTDPQHQSNLTTLLGVLTKTVGTGAAKPLVQQPLPTVHQPPTPQPAPKPGPQPAPKPVPQPAPKPAPQPAPQQGPKPGPQQVPKPAAHPAPKPAPQQGPKPGPQQVPKPAAQPAPKPAPHPAPPPAPPPPPPPPPPTPLTTSGNSIDTGRYIITFSTGYTNNFSSANDGQIQIFDTKTNTYVDVFGDPHVLTSSGAMGEFQKNGLEIQLADGTVVQIKPTSLSDGVAHIADVAVSKNGQTVGVSGLYHAKTIQMTGVLSESAGTYDPWFNTGDEAVLVGSDQGLGTMSIMNANGTLTALNGTSASETNLDQSGLAGVAAIQALNALINSGALTDALKAELESTMNTLLDKSSSEAPGKVSNPNGTVDLYVNYNTNDSVSVSVQAVGSSTSQLVNTTAQGGDNGSDAIRLEVPSNNHSYVVTVTDNTTGKTYTQTVSIDPTTFTGATIATGATGSVNIASVADPSASTALPPPAPIGDAAFAKLQASFGNFQSDFLNLLKSQPDKSPGKILYNLYKLLGIAANSHYQGKIDTAKVQADIQTTIQNNQSYFSNLSGQINDKYAQQDLGISATAAAQQLNTYVDSPQFAQYLLTLNTTERATAINKYIGMIAQLDPSLGKTAMTNLLKSIMNLPSQVLNQLQTPEQQQESLAQIISLILDDARLGSGVLNNLSKYMQNAGLTQSQITKVANVLAKNLQPVLAAELAHPGSISADQIHSLTAELDSQLSSAGEVGLANRALETFSSKGLIGALGGASSIVGLITGFTGNSSQGEGAFFITGQTANALFAASKLNDLKKLFIDSGAAGKLQSLLVTLGKFTASQLQAAAAAAKGSVTAFANALAAGNSGDATEISTELAALPADQQASFLGNLETSGGAASVETAASKERLLTRIGKLPASVVEEAAAAAKGSMTAFAAALAAKAGKPELQGEVERAFGSLGASEQAQILGEFTTDVPGEIQSVAASADIPLPGAAGPSAAGSGGSAAPADQAAVTALEAEGLTPAEAATVASITSDVTAGSSEVAAAGLAGRLGASLTWANFLKYVGFLGPVGTALYGVGAGAEAFFAFQSGNIAAGVTDSLATASLGVLAAANAAGLFFTTTEWIPVVGEIAGAVTLILSILGAILGGSKTDPNQTLAQSGVGNGQDYWQPDVSSAQSTATQGSPVQALIGLLQQIQQQNHHMVDGGHVAIPTQTPIVAKLQPLIDQLKALPAGQPPSAALLSQIQSVLGITVNTQLSPNSDVTSVDQLAFEDIEALLAGKPIPA